MILSRHCTLCENEIKSLEKGVTCALTQKKPDFEKKCPDIQFDDKFQEKLEIAHLELEIIRSTKKSMYWNFYSLIIIGIVLILIGDSLVSWTIGSIFAWEVKIGFIITGITVLSTAFYKRIAFRRNIKMAQFTIDKIDVVLEKYDISYQTTIDFKEKIHGTQQASVSIRFNNWAKKYTTTTYIIDS